VAQYTTLKALFKRYRRPGDIVFAWAFLAISVFLLSQLANETAINSSGKLYARPYFWPAISLSGMALFAALHLVGSILSERIEGRWREILFWVRSIEYALWFLAYAMIVPTIGYLLSSIILLVLLVIRVGYYDKKSIGYAALAALVIVVIFKAFLRVKLPSGAVYEYLPDAIRQFMMVNF
jgi:hypothetical protein